MSGINGAEQDAGGLPFSDAARRLLADALQEAIGLGHVYIGTEHLLLALARRSNEVAGLTDLGIDWGRVRTRVAEVVNPGTPAATPERSLPYTTRTQRVFTLAGESARDLGHPRVEAEHLLLGLVREGTGIAAFVLGEQGVTEQQVLELAQRSGVSERAPSRAADSPASPADVGAIAVESLDARSLEAALTVRDLAASLAWYRDVLGFTVDREHRREERLVAVSLRAGAVRILLGQDDGAKGLDRAKGEGFSLQLTTAQSIDAIAARVKSRGGTLESEPFDAFGVRAFRLRDPDGFRFTISSPREA